MPRLGYSGSVLSLVSRTSTRQAFRSFMKITDVQAVYPAWKKKGTGAWQEYYWQIVVRIETDAGVVGYGCGGGGEPGKLIVNGHLRDALVGRTIGRVDDIRDTWDHLYARSLPYGRGGIVIMALSGIDLALWDLLGKAEGKPVYELIGGLKKKTVRAYATGGDPARVRDRGYTAVKCSHQWREDADYDKAAALAARIRGMFGRDALLMFDCYMSWDAGVALRMRELLGEYEPYWFEDLITPDHLDELAGLRPRLAPVLLAGGEHDFSHHAFGAIARAGALDLWQPDITWCGGITAGLRILELARAHDVPVCPHRGGEIWGLHLIAATDCMDLAETHPDRWIDLEDMILLDEPVVSGGEIAPPDRPGFGVTLKPAYV